jgi:hypothetical protein
MDEDTVYKIWLIDSLFVGDGGIPHTAGEEPSPDPWNELRWVFAR